jgi:hypothetical protein
MGVATLFILPDYPQTAKFLSERERDAIINRLSEDAPTKASKTWDSDQVRRLLTDPTFYTFNFVWLCHAIGGLGLTYVLPTVIFQLGMYSSWLPQHPILIAYRLFLLSHEQCARNATIFGYIHCS